MKEFNLEEARQGKPVCTRDGRKVRILCFDLKDDQFPICAAVEDEGGIESSEEYTLGGRYLEDGVNNNADLMMAQEKHEGWINIGRKGTEMYATYAIYPSEEIAKLEFNLYPNIYIATAKIEWEE